MRYPDIQPVFRTSDPAPETLLQENKITKGSIYYGTKPLDVGSFRGVKFPSSYDKVFDTSQSYLDDQDEVLASGMSWTETAPGGYRGGQTSFPRAEFRTAACAATWLKNRMAGFLLLGKAKPKTFPFGKEVPHLPPAYICCNKVKAFLSRVVDP